MLCSSCMQPWHSDRYKTCDRCRQRYTRHQHTYGLIPPTERSPPLSALSNFTTDRVVCSNCAQPWQSSQYKTCDRCRERAAQRAAQKRAKSDDARHSYAPPLSPPSGPAKRRCPPHPNHNLRAMVDPVRFQEAYKQAVGLLHDEYLARATASESFPPDITSTHI
jgi:hypothetical protein